MTDFIGDKGERQAPESERVCNENDRIRASLPDMNYKDKFIDEWLEHTRGMDRHSLAELTWHLANREWQSGYQRGVFKPDFE